MSSQKHTLSEQLAHSHQELEIQADALLRTTQEKEELAKEKAWLAVEFNALERQRKGLLEEMDTLRYPLLALQVLGDWWSPASPGGWLVSYFWGEAAKGCHDRGDKVSSLCQELLALLLLGLPAGMRLRTAQISNGDDQKESFPTGEGKECQEPCSCPTRSPSLLLHPLFSLLLTGTGGNWYPATLQSRGVSFQLSSHSQWTAGRVAVLSHYQPGLRWGDMMPTLLWAGGDAMQGGLGSHSLCRGLAPAP